MSTKPKIILHVGGHDIHPVHAQTEALMEWLAPQCVCRKAESLAAFEHLGECDLLIFLGMYYTGWEGRYRSPGEVHKRAFERYMTAGRPLLLHHGAIASYDDWSGFREMVGIHWTKDAGIAPEAEYLVHPLTSHPVVACIDDFQIRDEFFDRLSYAPWTRPDVHAVTKSDDRQLPALITIEGRSGCGGRTVYLAPGGNITTFLAPPVRRLWLNSIDWCLGLT